MSYPPQGVVRLDIDAARSPKHTSGRDGGMPTTTWQTARAGRGARPRPGPRWMNRDGLLGRRGPPERDDTRNLPLVPHLVHLGLEVLEILLGEVSEAALLEQVLAHGLARAAFHDGLGLAVMAHHAVLDLVERKDTALPGELTQLMAEHGVVVPALGARIERVHEGRPADGEGLANLVHHLDGVGGVDGGDVAALGVPGRQHARHVLLPARVDDPLQRARGAEGRIGAVGRRARELDVRVGVRLVVVHQDKRVVLLVRQGRRDGPETHVRPAPVAAEGDDVDRLGLHLALLHECLETRRRAERGRARGAELGVHPRDYPGRRVVRRVGHVHAPGRGQDYGPGPRRLDHEFHDQGRLATLTGAVAGGEVFLDGNLLNSAERLENLRGVRECLSHDLSPYSLTPSHCVLRGDFPVLAASKQRAGALETSSSVTSLPPSPQMKDSSGGRFSALYMAARISLATTPDPKGEPNE